MEAGYQLPPRLLIDVEQLARFDHHSGIQRVVKNVVETLVTRKQHVCRAVPVRLGQKNLVRWDNIVPAITGLAGLQQGPEVHIQQGDILLMLDASWDYFADFREIFARVRQQQGRVYTVVYDLIHTLYPHLTDPRMAVMVSRWLHAAVQNSDGLVCISRAVAEELRTYIQEKKLPHARDLKIGYFHLGAGIKAAAAGSALRDGVRAWFADKRPVFLIVGWLDVRKGQDVALEACENLWAAGMEVKLIFAGKESWNRREFVNRILSHPQYAKRLLWIDHPTDAEIVYCYRQAAALLFPSVTEGFGLPLIEAAHYGLPVICSDIPVFREIAGAYATYFTPASVPSLTGALHSWLLQPEHPDSARMPRLTWEQSANQLLDVILGDKWQSRLPEN